MLYYLLFKVQCNEYTNMYTRQNGNHIKEANAMNNNCGEPERAPHKREVRAVGRSVCLSVYLSVCLSICLSVYLSVCPYVHDTKIYKNSINLRVPSVVDCSV